MKKLVCALFVLFAVVPLIADTGGVVPIGADSNWNTDGMFRNISDHSITQQIGYITFKSPGFDDIIVKPTITLAPGETRRITDMQNNFDRGKNYILPIATGLEASVFLRFLPGTVNPRFEVSNVTAALLNSGTALDFYRVAVTYSPQFVSNIVIMNTGDHSQTYDVRLFGPKKNLSGSYDTIGDEFFSAPPGIWIVTVQHQMPDGGTLRICQGACGIGTGSIPPVYPFVVMGTADGGTEIVRYGTPLP